PPRPCGLTPMSAAPALLNKLPTAAPGRSGRLLWAAALGCVIAGVVAWGTQTLQGGVIGMWLFVAAAVLAALVLPFTYALVSPLFFGLAGWLVDMLPLVVLAGWTAVALRWAYGLARERRLPAAGRWMWVPALLTFWTALGIIVVSRSSIKHFLLLLGMQVIASAVIVACVDLLRTIEQRADVVAGLTLFIVVLSAGVFLQWVGVPIQPLQNTEVSERVEEAYGVNAFPNLTGMIKYAFAQESGALDLKRAIGAADIEGIPRYEVFKPRFGAYENELVVRFEGSARPVEDDLARLGISLEFDNVGLADANSVPRLRSFPRNALTYAGVSAAVFPLTFFLMWVGGKRRRFLGIAGAASCLFGAGFSLARGAWVAIALGVIYLLVDGRLSRTRKLQVLGAVIAGAAVLTTVFVVRYGDDPLNARAGAQGSVGTRRALYEDTVQKVDGLHILLGYGSERTRADEGDPTPGGRYIPPAGTHSTYLNYLFRTGVPGLLLIIALYALAALHARASALVREGDERLFSTLAATSIVIAGSHAVILSLYVEPIYDLVISIVIGLATAGTLSLGASILPWRTRGKH
ncbi:MAG: O-antigen ligase family protein, partial [Actinomycetota bacterium]|nr:O-antigen ligase family protein [Actinomycetota bacterium]